MDSIRLEVNNGKRRTVLTIDNGNAWLCTEDKDWSGRTAMNIVTQMERLAARFGSYVEAQFMGSKAIVVFAANTDEIAHAAIELAAKAAQLTPHAASQV